MVEWKASSYTGDNIITAQALYEGLWKSCASQSTGQIQCKIYDSLLQLPGNASHVKLLNISFPTKCLLLLSNVDQSKWIVQGTRGLMLSSILLSFISMIVAVVGMKCTTCMSEQPAQKDKVALAGGVIFMIAGLLALVGTSWYGHRIAQDFYSPLTPTNSRLGGHPPVLYS
ncbi:hypothetical protein XENOCAPTIV_024739 [Xenoophorus captivus]|uniref:Claudin n=1 Tax=Xenoophorus captivus TaxID=1517983 RepID=A0ABV0RT04_9TELE